MIQELDRQPERMRPIALFSLKGGYYYANRDVLKEGNCGTPIRRRAELAASRWPAGASSLTTANALSQRLPDSPRAGCGRSATAALLGGCSRRARSHRSHRTRQPALWP
jgi:hypothetical protein